MKRFNVVFNKIEEAIRQHPMLLALITNLLFFGLVYSFFTPRFQTNDDVGMMLNVAGISRTVDPCPYLMHSHYFIGAFLKLLYSFSISIPWYGMYLLSMVFLSHVTFLYIALVRNSRLSIIFVYALYMLLVGLELLINLQFTISSGLIGFAGIALLIFHPVRHADASIRSAIWNRPNLLAMLFLSFCVMIRWEGFLMVCMLALPIFMFSLIGQSRQRVLARLFTISIILVTCIGLDTINRAIWKSSEEWSSFYFFNELRSKMHGNNPLEYLELDEREAVLQSVDWSMNDYSMFQCFYFLDKDVFNADKLQKLLNAVPTFKDLSLTESAEKLKRICTNEFVLCATLIFILGGLVGFQKGGRLWILVLSLLIFPLIVLFLIYYLRPPPPRVYFTMAAFVSLIPLMVNYRLIESAPKIFKGRFLLRLVLGTVCMFFVFTFSTDRIKRFKEQSKFTEYNNNAIHSFMDLVAYRYPDDLFVTWGANFFWEYVGPFESLDYLKNFKAFNIGVSQLKPSNLSLLERQGVSDLLMDLVKRDDILLITSTNKIWNKELWFRTYLMEHRNVRTRLTDVYRTKRFMIYEVYAID